MKKFLVLIFTFFYINLLNAEPLVRILVEPCKYTGKTITTSGVLAFPSPLIEPTKARLFLSEMDYKYNNFEHSVIVPVSKKTKKNNMMKTSQFVHVEGVFDCSISSHGVVGAGGFVSIEKLIPATKNPNFVAVKRD